MNTIIRAHVKNKERLETLERMIRSWYDKRLDILGNLYIVDDHSPMSKDVMSLAYNYGIGYMPADGDTGDTKNGLYNSMYLARELDLNRPFLACVDDAVFGQGVTERIFRFLATEEPRLDYGFVGMFACYEDATRNPCKVPNMDLWAVPHQILYALVAHIFHPKLRDLIINDWVEIITNKKPYPQMCDDLWVKNLCIEHKIPIYNFMKDYAQHTGMTNRTFGNSTSNSDYRSRMFVGE